VIAAPDRDGRQPSGRSELMQAAEGENAPRGTAFDVENVVLIDQRWQ
jgi:hypothetical protein